LPGFKTIPTHIRKRVTPIAPDVERNGEGSPKNLIMPCVNLSIIIGTGVGKDKSQMEEEADAAAEEEARDKT